MQYDFRGSSPSGARNGNPSGLPGNNSFRTPASLETGPGTVPIQVYQQVAEELESARQQVSRLSSENQRLHALHQQLSGEVTAIAQEFQGQLGQALKRLQQISIRLADTSQAAAPEREAAAAPFRGDGLSSEPDQASPPYDFLNRLKRRQARSEVSPFSSNVYPTSSYSDFAASSFEPRSQPSTLPPRPRQDTPTEPSYPRAGYQIPSLEELMQNMGGEVHSTSVYQRVRDQHHGSQGSAVLWMAAAVLLVVASFGLGFVAVQPFLRNNPPPSPVKAPQ
ncbi:hypothetical protein [Synechococcus sp. H60.2]|uniref:hypothetical protein n=1 Tax=unclassified Synechococcus TaxID=2626047 RepID=UPI0039C01095